ncbi:MAG: hypothetical protein GXP35_12600 [Actinobacteria bacterium]|nr:hypothetical protein [Actinomycetota bacterium]
MMKIALPLIGLIIVVIGALSLGETVEAADDNLAFGAYANRLPGESRIDAITNLELDLGRQLEIVRRFALWDEQFPAAEDVFAEAGGRDLMLSVKPKRTDGTVVLWADIGAALPGDPLHDEMVQWTDAIAAYEGTVYFTLHHEPEAKKNLPFGEDADFVAAFRNFVDIVRAGDAANVEIIWIMTSWSFEVDSTDRRYAPKWYPGDAWVDHAGADAYNWYACKGDPNAHWRSLEDLIEDFRIWGQDRPDLGLWLPEFGSDEHPDLPLAKAQWIEELVPLFSQPSHQQFSGILTFSSEHEAPGSSCDWWVDSSAEALAAYAALGADPLFNQVEPPAEPSSIAIVVKDPAAPSAGDNAIVARLQAAGYEVSMHDDTDVIDTDVIDADVVLISSTVSSFALRDRLADIPASIVLAKSWLFGDYGLSASNGSLTRATDGDIVDTAHPIAAGLTGTVTLLTTSDRFPVGIPGATADVVLEVDGDPTLWVYDEGDLLPSGTAASGCRSTLHAFKDTAANYSPDGWLLFDATITWAANC